MLHYRKFVKDLGVLGFVLMLARIKGIAILAILTKSLGAESYGIWAQILITLNLMSPVILLGLPHALMRFLPGTKTLKDTQEQIWSVVALILTVTLLAVLPFLLFPETIGNLIQTPSNLIILLAFLIILESLDLVFMNIFRAFEEIGKYSFFNFVLTTGEIGFVGIAVFMGYGLFGAVLSLIVIRGIILFFSLSMLLWKIGFKLPDFSNIKTYLKFGLPTVVTNISHWTVQASDRYLIGGFLGVLFVGYYVPAYTIGLIINLFFLPVLLVLQPTLSKLFSENKIGEIKKYLSYSLKYLLLITIPAVFGLIVLSKQILIIFSTHEIAVQASSVIPFVATSILLYGVHGIFSQVLFLFKKTNIVGAIWIGTAVISVILNVIFIPILGIFGAAITTLASYILALLLTLYSSYRYLSFPIDWMFIGKSIAAAFLMSSVLFVFHAQGLWETITAVILGVIVYGILILLFKTFKKNEIEFFRTFLKK